MKRYKFGEHLNQTIVDGILQGYKNYLEERQEKRESMKISSAYAWVRGNHIDDQTATLSEELGIEYLYAKAGYSWGYLQFNNKKNRVMFIVKNGRYLNKDNVSVRKGPQVHNEKLNQNHYLYKLAQINENADLPRTEQLELAIDNESVTFTESHTQIEMDDEEVKELQNRYDYFYIVSYELDLYGMVSRVQLFLPSSVDGRAHVVDDLTKYIESSTVDLSTIDSSIAQKEQELQTEYPDAAWFNIATHDERAEDKKDIK